MLRYLNRLQNRDLAMDHVDDPLGSAMKLNATAEMILITWPEFGNIHPFAPDQSGAGYLEMIGSPTHLRAEITGFAAIACSRTPAPRANTPACCPSAATTPAGRAAPRHLPDPVRPTAPTLPRRRCAA